MNTHTEKTPDRKVQRTLEPRKGLGQEVATRLLLERGRCRAQHESSVHRDHSVGRGPERGRGGKRPHLHAARVHVS